MVNGLHTIMKLKNLSLLLVFGLFACNQPNKPKRLTDNQVITGTWQLLTDRIITKGDTVNTFPVKGQEQVMIKMYNDTHFAFFMHDTKHGKVKTPVYDTGAGTYKLSGTDYSEHLEYCNYRDWENRDFKFKLTIKNDTLTQRGIERIDSLKVNREIVETYVRIK